MNVKRAETIKRAANRTIKILDMLLTNYTDEEILYELKDYGVERSLVYYYRKLLNKKG